MSQHNKVARQLRENQTRAEMLLWSLLRGRQVCGLKFRRQHRVHPYFCDFACVERRLIVEVDGGYHELVGEADLTRESYLRDQGWDVIRFTNEEVEEDAEAVAFAIAKHLGLDYRFQARSKTGSGMEHPKSSNKGKS